MAGLLVGKTYIRLMSRDDRAGMSTPIWSGCLLHPISIAMAMQANRVATRLFGAIYKGSTGMLRICSEN